MSDKEYNSEITLPNNTLTKTGYTFAGWSDGTNTYHAGETYTILAENVNFTAVWDINSYSITFVGGEGATGTAPTLSDTEYNSEITLPNNTLTKTGYSFGGWSDGTNVYQAGETYTISAENVNFTAVWDINYYSITFVGGEGATGTVPTMGDKEYNSEITLPNNTLTKIGYSFGGWLDGTNVYQAGDTYIILAENVNFTVVWNINYYSITFVGGEGATGTAPSYGTQAYNSQITMPLNPFSKEGYDFIGWSDGINTYAVGAEYTMPASAVTFTALWEEVIVLYNVTFVGGEGTTGTAPTMSSQAAGAKITLPANTFSKRGYTFNGWSDGVNTYAVGAEYTMSASAVIFTALWEEYERVDLDGTANASGSYIYFGSYPQTKVTDTATISALGTYASNSWTSYGYYISGSTSSFMNYTDKTYNGATYRGVYFTSYRPYNSENSSSTDNSNQDNNGYYTSTVYWFKYEPILWRILTESNGTARILCETAIDSQQYDFDGSYSNNYANSTIRDWLNDTFYNTAFSTRQKGLIQTTVVDNSAASTGHSSNSYACANTSDKIFLLSYAEVVKSSYGFSSDTARQKKSSDYAKSQGCWTSTGSSYVGNCWWWLRSPDYLESNYARSVYDSGRVYDLNDVVSTYRGVVPALTISLS